MYSAPISLASVWKFWVECGSRENISGVTAEIPEERKVLVVEELVIRGQFLVIF